MYPKLSQEIQGGLVHSHDAAQFLWQYRAPVPALPALCLEGGALEEGRETDVQALWSKEVPKALHGAATRAKGPPNKPCQNGLRESPPMREPRGAVGSGGLALVVT